MAEPLSTENLIARIRRFLFERSPEWVNRMVLDDERLEALAKRGQRLDV